MKGAAFVTIQSCQSEGWATRICLVRGDNDKENYTHTKAIAQTQ